MRIRDMVLLGLILLWLFLVLCYLVKKKKNSGCAGCSGAYCGSCKKKKQS